ncbi:hypothetical protein CR513_47224, partial [Mucuna pruriens]
MDKHSTVVSETESSPTLSRLSKTESSPTLLRPSLHLAETITFVTNDYDSFEYSSANNSAKLE